MTEIENIDLVVEAASSPEKMALLFATILFGIIAIKLVLLIAKRFLLLSAVDNALIRFMLTSLSVILGAALILYAMKLIGIPLTSMIAILSAAGVAIGLAIQDSIANVANGLILIGTHPFKVGDYVQIGTDEGTIDEIRLMNTVLTTVDNRRLILPNKMVFTSRIMNYNANPLRRMDFVFTIDYSSDLDQAIEITRKAVASSSYVAREPKPRVEFYAASASSLDISVWCWASSAEYWNTYFSVQKAVYDAYKAAGVDIPSQQLMISERKPRTTRRITASRAEDGSNG